MDPWPALGILAKTADGKSFLIFFTHFWQDIAAVTPERNSVFFKMTLGVRKAQNFGHLQERPNSAASGDC